MKQEISVRDLSMSDIPYILRYWFHSPAGFIESIGVDANKLPSEHALEATLIEKCQHDKQSTDPQSNALIIICDDTPVGFHTLSPVEHGNFGIFHAHIWDHDMRNKGIAKTSYPLACAVFMQRFKLQKILFKTPQQNTGALRVKEHLGIRYVRDETVNFGIIRDGTVAKVFELTANELQHLAIHTHD